jgi:hypothetical protein
MLNASADQKTRFSFATPRKSSQHHRESLQDLVDACRRHANPRFIALNFRHG